MSDPSVPLSHVVHQAFSTVACTAGLPWGVKTRIWKRMERAARAYAISYVNLDDFAEWVHLLLEDLLSDEDIRPVCRFSLADWFAGEVLAHLTGDFDSDAAD